MAKHQFAFALSMNPRPLQRIHRLEVVVEVVVLNLFRALPPCFDSLRQGIDLLTNAVQECFERWSFDGCCGDAVGVYPIRLWPKARYLINHCIRPRYPLQYNSRMQKIASE